MNPLLKLIFLLLLVPYSALAQDIGTLTMRDGSLRLIRGTEVLQPSEGIRLRQGDILESAEPGFAQLEFTGGAIVALGPSTRVYLFSHGSHSGMELVLLNGWLKGQTSSGAGSFRYLSPLLAATSKDGTVVMHAGRDSAELFVESGSANVSGENRGGSSRDGSTGKAGQFFSRSAGKNVSAASHMPTQFVDSMPQPFKDTLPSRLQRFAGKRAEPRRDHEVSYPEVESWLTMPVAWRRGFVGRFEPRLSDPAFRRGIESHINQHPEWDPILHPEKYQRKAAADTANAQHGRTPQ